MSEINRARSDGLGNHHTFNLEQKGDDPVSSIGTHVSNNRPSLESTSLKGHSFSALDTGSNKLGMTIPI